jgi:hypothetical protein
VATCAIAQILLVRCESTVLTFDDRSFAITFRNGVIHIASDEGSTAEIRQLSQQVAYKSQILGGMVLHEHREGEVRYSTYFRIDWDEDEPLPSIWFRRRPIDIIRRYHEGQAIELGLEPVSTLRVTYRDGVEAIFERQNASGFRFSFTTGFYGSFWTEPDGSCLIKFRGDHLRPTEEPYDSQSKFIVSRSKYTGNLLLILQDNASVRLS